MVVVQSTTTSWPVTIAAALASSTSDGIGVGLDVGVQRTKLGRALLRLVGADVAA